MRPGALGKCRNRRAIERYSAIARGVAARLGAYLPRLAAAALLAPLLAGCTPIRPFYPELPAEVSAKPNYVCAGDTVRVAWDLHLPVHRDFCEYPTGGYDRLRSCGYDSDCPDGGRCYDGICCAATVPFSECGDSCSPDSIATLTFDPPGGMSPVSRPQGSGSTSFSPSQSTAITLTGEWSPPPNTEGPATTRVVVVDAPPLETLVMNFPFVCSGDSFSWSDYDLELAKTYPSSRVEVGIVRNTSGHQIELSDGVHPPVILDAGEPTTELNGPLDGTYWSAELTPLATTVLLPPRCTVDTRDPYPSLSVEVRLVCVSDDP